jgi:prepilin-type N-terminal cleavage/methylation domain-containing protein
MMRSPAIRFQHSAVNSTASATKATAYDPLRTGHNGFSLVEVTLALAIIAVALVAIIGLLPQGVQSSRSAADNTLAATILQDTLSQCRSQPFNNIQICNQWNPGGNCINTVKIDLTVDNLGLGTIPDVLDYDQDGYITNGTSYYRLTIRHSRDPSLQSLARVSAVVSWPALSSSPLNNVTNVTMIARYQ